MAIDIQELTEPKANGHCANDVPGFQTAPDAPKLPRTIIRPANGWQLVNVRELWQYRELLYFLTWRDVKVRYKQTVLGAAWAVLQPAMMMVVFSIFFGRMAKVNTGGLPYPLFVFCGLLPWTFFATAIANAGNSVVGSERLITKIYFPRLAIPFASVGAALVDFAVAFGMLVALMIWYQVSPTWNLLLVPPLVALFTLAALGVGTMLAALNVAYRDFRYVIPFLVQLWMFATPTVYMQAVQEGSGFGVQGSEKNDSLSVRERAGVRAANPKSKIQNPKSDRAAVPPSAADVPVAATASATRTTSAFAAAPAALWSRADSAAEPASAPLAAAESQQGLVPPNPQPPIPNPGSKGAVREAEGIVSPNPQSPTPNPGSEGAVPNNIQHLLNLNPLTGLVAAFRAAVLGGAVPWAMLRWSSSGVLLSFIVGCLYFRKVEDSFADII